MFGFLSYYTPHVDHEVMGHKFWICYKENVAEKILKLGERNEIIEKCRAF